MDDIAEKDPDKIAAVQEAERIFSEVKANNKIDAGNIDTPGNKFDAEVSVDPIIQISEDQAKKLLNAYKKNKLSLIKGAQELGRAANRGNSDEPNYLEKSEEEGLLLGKGQAFAGFLEMIGQQRRIDEIQIVGSEGGASTLQTLKLEIDPIIELNKNEVLDLLGEYSYFLRRYLTSVNALTEKQLKNRHIRTSHGSLEGQTTTLSAILIMIGQRKQVDLINSKAFQDYKTTETQKKLLREQIDRDPNNTDLEF